MPVNPLHSQNANLPNDSSLVFDKSKTPVNSIHPLNACVLIFIRFLAFEKSSLTTVYLGLFAVSNAYEPISLTLSGIVKDIFNFGFSGKLSVYHLSLIPLNTPSIIFISSTGTSITVVAS